MTRRVENGGREMTGGVEKGQPPLGSATFANCHLCNLPPLGSATFKICHL
jgi:hypothetical protein